MSSGSHQPGISPSILDRLIDPDSAGTAWRRGYGLEQTVAAVRRDLGDLLNPRTSGITVPPQLSELGKSLLMYGLPDIASMRATSAAEREQIGRMIEAAINTFEPRLAGVRVILVDAEQTLERRVRFHIDARLRVEPAPEVVFQTVVELSSGRATVTQNA